MLRTGNALKAAVRFVSYDHFKHMLADKEVSNRTEILIHFLSNTHSTLRG